MALSWRPTASHEVLQRRALLLQEVRTFFRERQVLEVETPLLARAAVTDLHLESVRCQVDPGLERFLPTSPESAMKRLLANGSGPIYQICKAFRSGEHGRRHQPEFTILEWYRPGFTLEHLAAEVEDLVREVTSDLTLSEATHHVYRDLWLQLVGIDPHAAELQDLREAAAQEALGSESLLNRLERDDLLGLIMSEVVEPQLPRGAPVFVHDFPASQAAMSAIEPRGQSADEKQTFVARRFELYIDGLELANAYVELLDASELRERMQRDIARREALGRATPPLDEELLAAMHDGLPACCGVALGIDRLLMVLCGASRIDDVLSFPFDRSR